MTYTDNTPTPRRRPLWGYNDGRRPSLRPAAGQPIAHVRVASTNAAAYWSSLRESLAEVIGDLHAYGVRAATVVPAERNPLPADECSAEIDSMKDDLRILRDELRTLRAQYRSTGAASATAGELEADRLYERAGEVYRTVRSGAGNLYAKIWTGSGWDYAAGAIRHLRPEHRMSVERAVELSLRIGRCIRCGALLTAEQSVERGIGPVCITKI